MKPDNVKIYKVTRKAHGHIVIAVDDPHSYQDIVDMPNPINVSFGIRIYNYTGQTLWFRAQGSGSEDGGSKWTWNSARSLGSIASGSNAYFCLKNLGSRVKPGSAMDDSITITVRAYTDSGYTNEVGSGYPILITYHWIKSTDLTLLDLDNFDGGTLENWSAVNELNNGGGYPTLAIATDYVLSSPNSALLHQYNQNTGLPTFTMRARIEKAFTIPSCSVAYFVCNQKWRGQIRTGSGLGTAVVRWSSYRIYYDTTELVRIEGVLKECSKVNPLDYEVITCDDNWYRMVAKLPVNLAITLKVAIEYFASGPDVWRPAVWYHSYSWFDDLKVVYQA